MNKEFLKKMIKAERLRYEAIKELMPDKLRQRTEEFEKDAFGLLKEVALEIMKDNIHESKESDNHGQADTSKSTKKVEVDFS